MHDIDRAREALWAIPCPAEHESWWPIVGSALAEGISEDEALRWCESGPNFNRAEALPIIRSLARRPDTGRRGSLFTLARNAGWREQTNGRHYGPTRRPEEPRKPEPKAERPPFDCAAVWRDAVPATAAHGYIASKRGLPEGLRVVPADSKLMVNRQSVAGWLAVPLYDDGELATLQFVGPGGGKLTAPGPMRGWFTVGGPIAPGATVYVCEGIGQAWSAHQATQAPAVVAFGLARMKAAAQALAEQGARVVLVADVGAEATIEKAAKEIGCAWISPPAELGKNGDINDLHRRDGLEAVAQLLEGAHEPEQAGQSRDEGPYADTWPRPANLFREIAAPRFDQADVPPAIRRMAEAFASSTGFDISGAIVAATVAAAAGIDDRFRLAVRPDSDWFESARLWAVLIGTPSAGKSPTLRAAVDGLKTLHSDLFAKWRKENAEVKESERAPTPAVLTNDATTEALADRLRDNPRGILMLTEEFASWIGGIDAYRDGAGARNRGEWLQLYDGGPHQVDRVKRGSFLVPNWGASVLAACTPAGLRDQLRKLPDDGLIHRFIPCVMAAPADPAGGNAREALREWSALTKQLYEATTCDAGTNCLRISTQARLTFENETRAIRDAVDAAYELSPALASHLGKHPGMLARVALTFHLVDRRQGDAIETDTMEMSARFMRTVRRHAAAMFLGILSTAPALEVARGLARSIAADDHRPVAIGRNYMTQRCRAFRQAQDFERRLAVQALEDAHWLAPVPESRAYGGWGASEWAVNPAVFELFAAEGEAHRQRRQALREILGER